MDLEELRAFLAVAKTGSFVAGAEQLGAPRATLRRRVDELEARTGVALLVRTRDGAALTAPGRALAQRAETLLEEASALIRSVREVGADPAGIVRLSLPVGMPPSILAAALGTLRVRAPNVRIVAQFSNAALTDRLEDVDVAVHFGPVPPRSRWVTRPLLSIRAWLLASPAYLARRGRPTSVGELTAHDLLSWDGPGWSPSRWPLRSGGELPVSPCAVASDAHLLRHLTAAGQGIALLPDAGLPEPGLGADALEPVLEEEIGAEVALMLSVPAVLADVPRIRLFLDLAEEITAALR